MLATFRRAVVDSKVAAITIAVLFFVAFDNLLEALREPAYRGALFLVTAAGEREFPYAPRGLNFETGWMLLESSIGISHAVVALIGAWLVSKWVYGVGPLKALASLREDLLRKPNA